MKRLTVLLLTVIFASFIFAPRAEVNSQRPGKAKARYVEGQIIVKLNAEAKPSVGEVQAIDPSQLAQLVLPGDGSRADAVESGAPGESGIYVVRLAKGVSVEQALQRASKDPRFEYAEPDYEIHEARMPDDSRFGELWGLLNTGTFGKPGADIGATTAWDLTTGSDDVVVAVADTGVDLDHPDLAANAWVNSGEIAGNGIDDDNNGFIDDVRGWNFIDNNNVLTDPPITHGTHVAGTIGAVGNNGLGVTGVAWHVKLMSLKFLGSVPGTTSNAVKCIKYAIEQKKRGVNVRAINASWGGSGDSQSLHSAIAEAGDAGIVFVCAAGNGDTAGRGVEDATDEFPAAWSADLSSAISVAALDIGDLLPSWSNYGHTNVTVAAPGVSILSTVPFNGYGTLTGTSMSTPHVSGIVALLASYIPSLNPSQIKQRIIRTAEPVLSVASKAVASGRANAFNALTDRVVPAGSVAINNVTTNKKFVYVDGLNFRSGTSVVEVNGVPLSKTKGDEGYAVGNGTVTRLFVKLGKPGVKSTFPQFTQVFVTVFNPETGERSQPKGFTRF